MARKLRTRPVIIGTMILVLAGLAGVWWLLREKAPMEFVRYEEFGIDMPVSYSMHGIDISKFQGNVNWMAVRQMEVDDIKI
ncbi:MAG: glycoside hydrolase family 25 protein, partial [Chitinophaga sp.]